MKIRNLKTFQKHVLKSFPEESCGVLVSGRYIPCKNIAEDPYNNFEISMDEYLQHENVEAIIHSHTYEHAHKQGELRGFDRRCPSMSDMVGQIDTGVTWGIVATEGENVTDVVWFGDDVEPAPLEGRSFIHGIYDCYTLVRDYYKQHGVQLDPFPRPPKWQDWNKGLYQDNWQSQGFVEVQLKDIQVGDFVLMRWDANYVNHAGVYVGNDRLLHHAIRRLSGHVPLSRSHAQITLVLRHPKYVP